MSVSDVSESSDDLIPLSQYLNKMDEINSDKFESQQYNAEIELHHLVDNGKIDLIVGEQTSLDSRDSETEMSRIGLDNSLEGVKIRIVC